jgi:hypothetical protein
MDTAAMIALQGEGVSFPRGSLNSYNFLLIFGRFLSSTLYLGLHPPPPHTHTHIADAHDRTGKLRKTYRIQFINVKPTSRSWTELGRYN